MSFRVNVPGRYSHFESKYLKVDIWDILVICGWLMIGCGVSMINWRFALIVNGGLLMLGGALALARGK